MVLAVAHAYAGQNEQVERDLGRVQDPHGIQQLVA